MVKEIRKIIANNIYSISGGGYFGYDETAEKVSDAIALELTSKITDEKSLEIIRTLFKKK